jgi:hypothetical protein
VQQHGAEPTRQHKLEVSAPSDGFELEADRAADAMVSGSAFSVSRSAVVAAREKDKKDDKKDDKAPKLPTLLDDEVTIPIQNGALGNAKLSKNKVSWGGEAKAGAKLVDLEYKAPVQYGAIVIDTAISGGVSLKASATGGVTASVTDAPPPWIDGKMLAVAVSGGGSGAAKAEAEILAGLGVGAAKAMFVSGNVSGGVEAKAAVGASMGGSVTVNPNNKLIGDVFFKVSGELSLAAKADLNIDVVLLSDREHLYSAELGKHELGKTTLDLVTHFGANGVSDTATVETKWNGLPGQLRQTRPFTPEERKKFFPVDQGASGGRPEDQHILTETELNEQATKSANDKLAAHKGKDLPVVNDLVEIESTLIHVTPTYTQDQKDLAQKNHQSIVRATRGVVTGWTLGSGFTVSGDKTVAAYEKNMLHGAQIQMTASKVDYNDIPTSATESSSDKSS